MTPDNFDKLLDAFIEKLGSFHEAFVKLLREQNEQYARIEKSLDRIENLLRGGAGK